VPSALHRPFDGAGPIALVPAESRSAAHPSGYVKPGPAATNRWSGWNGVL